MGKDGKQPKGDQRETAHYAHELNRQAVLTPAECAEEGEAPELVVLDAIAEKFRARGRLSAAEALQYARDALGVFAALDRAAGGNAGAETVGPMEGRVASETLRVMTIRLVQAPKPRFSAGCLLLAMGAAHNGITSSNAWADRQHVSHELAADEVEEWQRVMGLPRNAWQKSAEAKASYKDSNGKQSRT